MNTHQYPTTQQVLDDLGETFVNAFIDSVDGARQDFQEFRRWQPGWFPGFTERFTANFLHERIWDRLVRQLEDVDGIQITDEEPVRQVRSGTAYLMRIKRHHPNDRISTVTTKASTAFYSNRQLTLEGLESYNLVLGYYWDADLRAVGDPVLSFRDSIEKPVWAIKLNREEDNVSGFTWDPIGPDLPEIDLTGLGNDTEETAGS